MEQRDYFYRRAWKQFQKHPLGVAGLFVVLLYVIVGVYAPFLASSKPIAVQYEGTWYFPLFRYLFYKGFFTKGIDLFFNLLIFTMPLAILVGLTAKGKFRKISLTILLLAQIAGFIWLMITPPKDPAANTVLIAERQQALKEGIPPTWQFELDHMTPYAKLNLILRYQQRKEQNAKLIRMLPPEKAAIPTLWQLEKRQEKETLAALRKVLNSPDTELAAKAKARIQYILDRQQWLQDAQNRIRFLVMPLVRPYHWEDDAGGDQAMNRYVSWLDLTRVNRKDLTAALIFGIRISLVVGILAVGLSLVIGMPIGAFSGYYGGTFDIIVSRLLEIWESMPVLFMLLLVVSMVQSKSIFLVIGVIGFFGWTTITRYIRGEFFKQRNLSYVEACRAVGFHDRFIMFSHIMPNALPPVLTLIPFAIMGAIMSEAGLSFLGLGEEGSCSWGVLMDEGRTAFPSESYLLWPPAILLTILLIAIALVGDALRDAIDPKSY